MALSIEAARRAVLAEVHPLPTEEVAVQDALGRVLAEDVAAAADVPAFDNSAMDGFAVRAGAAGRTLRLVSESRAGAPAAVAVGEGEAIRISTGAAIRARSQPLAGATPSAIAAGGTSATGAGCMP